MTPSARRLMAGFAACVATASPVRADEAGSLDLSLEELLQTEVVTVSRKSQTVQSAAAAVFVITREDIERSGATSIPEALRLAPGLEVARIANNRWAITARGFNGRMANKLQVLMDGRSLYAPMFSGVLWETEDTLLEDIDRIEVIRGPGAAMWGANAVNGVINIITRKARDTQGTLLVAGGGSEERGFAGIRYGGMTDSGHYRIWAKGFSRDAAVTPAGQRGNDDWHAGRVGFRSDWMLDASDRLTVSGSAYRGPTDDRWRVADATVASGFVLRDIRQDNAGANLLVRYDFHRADTAEATLQAYINHSDIALQGILHQRRQTLDLDFQHRSRGGQSHDLIWGLGYRHSRDDITTSVGGMASIAPTNRDLQLFSAFVHDEIALLPETLRLMLGLRLEYNSFTGLEPQPNARLAWTPTPTQTVWTALSRAVRTPSRAEQDGQLDLFARPPVLFRNVPRPDRHLEAEVVTALELGYRHQFDNRLSMDVSAFVNDYDDLRSAQLDATLFPGPYVLQTVIPNNQVKARAHGLELAVDWTPLPGWRLQPGYTLLRVHGTARSADPIDQMNARYFTTSAPRQQFSLRSSWSPDRRQNVDLWLRHVGSLGDASQIGNHIPAYNTLDLRYAWRPIQDLELSLTGQNLLQRRHAEYVADFLPAEPLQIQRGAYFKAKWQF